MSLWDEERFAKFREPPGRTRRPQMAKFKVVHAIANDDFSDAIPYAETEIDTGMSSDNPKWETITAPVLARIEEIPSSHHDLNQWVGTNKVIHRWNLHDAICWLLLRGKIEKIDGTVPAVYKVVQT